MEYILIGLVVGGAFYYLLRKIRKEIKKGQCASCPLYDKCDSKEKV
ncbi:FeoB-associated Cys-rich membrane protein [Persephonella sp.]|nr:FeoB-associated Cys-rich membrane protein [Persephonella sp.]